MALATLSIDLEAKLAKFEAGMEQAAKAAEKNAAATEAAWKKAGSLISNFVAGLGIGAAVAGLEVLREKFRSNVEALDKLNDVADATGASIENISALEDLARRTGTTLDVATTAMVKLNGALNEAKPDSPIAQVFKTLGIEVSKLKGLDPAEALRQVAVALSGYADDGNKARVVQELFGKSLREVAPLLNDLAEKNSLVATTTTEQAKEAEKFNKQLFELQANSALTARRLTSELIPALNSIFDSVKRNGGVWSAFVEGAKINFDISSAKKAQQDLDAAVKQLEAGLRVPEEQRTNLQKARIEELRAEVAQLLRDANAAAESLKRTANGGKLPEPKTRSEMEAEARRQDKATFEKSSIEVPDVAKPKKARAEQLTEAQRALAAYVSELEKELDKTTELSEQQKALNFLKTLGTTGQIPQVRELVLGMERQITLAKQDAAIRADNLRLTKEQEAAEKSLNDEIFKLSGREGENRKINLTNKLEEQIANGANFSAEELNRIVNGIAGISDKGKESIDALDELTKQFGRNTQNLLGDTLEKTLSGHFDGIGRSWSELLQKMAAQALALKLGQNLFGDFFKTGELGGVFGGLASSFKDNGGFSGLLDSFASWLPKFASGGDHIGGLRLVGENGPELEATGPARIFNANQTQRILRGAAPAQAGPTIVIPIASGVTRPELVALVPMLTQQIKASIQADSRRPGGRS